MTLSHKGRGRPPNPINSSRLKDFCEAGDTVRCLIQRARPCPRVAARFLRDFVERNVTRDDARRGAAGYAELHEILALIIAAFHWGGILKNRDLVHLSVILLGDKYVRFLPTKPGEAESKPRINKVSMARALSHADDPMDLKKTTAAVFRKLMELDGILVTHKTAQKHLTPELREDAAQRKGFRDNPSAAQETHRARAVKLREVSREAKGESLLTVARQASKSSKRNARQRALISPA